jgi:hypothetical protein
LWNVETVRWSRRGLRWKVILVSFMHNNNECAFLFWKVPLLFDLPSYIVVYFHVTESAVFLFHPNGKLVTIKTIGNFRISVNERESLFHNHILQIAAISSRINYNRK